MNLKKLFLTVTLGLSLALTSGCAIKGATSTAGQPTPFMKVVATNDALATSNDSIVDAVKILNTNGSISVTSTAAVLKIQKQIAQADIQLTNILNQGPTVAQANVASITGLITTIQTAANTLQAQGVIPNTPAAQQVATDINTIVTLATTVANELVAAGIK